MFTVNTKIIACIVRNIRTTNNTFLIQITQRKRIGRSSRTTRNAQWITFSGSIILKHGIYPVWIINIAICIVNWFDLTPIIRRISTIYSLFIHNNHILFCIQHICSTRNILYTIISIKRNLGFTLFSLFRSNQYYTIGSLCTIDSSRSRIFQHVDTFNIGRVQGRDITTYTINKV